MQWVYVRNEQYRHSVRVHLRRGIFILDNLDQEALCFEW